MPVFGTLSSAEIEQLRKRRSNQVELSPYLEYLSGLAPGDWGYVLPEGNDRPRTVKRRLNLAAKQVGKNLTYQRRRIDEERIIFQATEASARRRGRPPKDGRG